MQLPHIFLAGVSVTCCAEGSTSKFLASVSAARCEEAGGGAFKSGGGIGLCLESSERGWCVHICVACHHLSRASQKFPGCPKFFATKLLPEPMSPKIPILIISRKFYLFRH